MARTTRPLTNTEILRSKADDKDLTLHDGDGLFLIVKKVVRNSGDSATSALLRNSKL